MKSLKKLLIPVIVLALLIGTYFAVIKLGEKAETGEEDDTAVVACKLDTSKVKCINWKYGDSDISVALEGDKWVLLTDKDFPFDGAYADAVLSNAAEVSSSLLVCEDASDTVQYGFSNPTVSAVFELSDGTEVKYYVGSESTTGDYYFMSDSSKNVYLVSSAFVDDYSRELFDMAVIEDIPSYDELSSFTVKSNDAVVSAKVTGKDDSAEYVFACGKEKVTANKDFADEFKSTVTSLAFNQLVNCKGDFGEYGLDKPEYEISVTGTSESVENVNGTFALYVSPCDEEDYYAYQSGSKCIYKISNSNISKLLMSDLSMVNQTTDE